MTNLTSLRRSPTIGMAIGTATSRITGLLRTVALAAALGVGSLSDAYNTANTVPNMLFALVAGGVIGSALVPMLVREDLIQLWGARRTLPGLRFSPRLHHPAVTELRSLGGWMLLYVGANQVALAAVIVFASTVDGGITAYQWAFMLMQLPYAVVAVSIFSSAYPDIARAAASGGGVTHTLRRPASRATILLLPCAAGLVLVAGPLAVVTVGADDAALVAAGVRGFAVALIPFALFQLLTRASYARSDTRTPALVNLAVNAAMVVIDVAVIGTVDSDAGRVLGLALGHASSYVVGCVLLFVVLARQGTLRGPLFGPGIGRAAVGVAAMAVAVSFLPDTGPQATRGGGLAALAIAAAVGGIVYGSVVGWKALAGSAKAGAVDH